MEPSQLLRLEESHRSSKITDNVLKCRHGHLSTNPTVIDEIMTDTGFEHFVTIESFKIDPSLITAFVERWRPETHTFHLPYGECTITLEDVAIHLGLNVNGRPVIGPSFFDWKRDCEELLGRVPEKTDMKGYEVKLSWLMNNFYQSHPVTDVEKQRFCRAHILNLIGSVVMPDKSGNRVHLMYLPLLRDLRRAHEYSWGSACLAVLYRELCLGSKLGTKGVGGCLMLLQSWIWSRLRMFAPCGPSTIFPQAARWSQSPRKFKGVPHGNLPSIRFSIDHMNVNEFAWMPYANIIPELGPIPLRDSEIWNACVPLICFSTVVWHQTDRVKLQFGMVQEIPQPPMNMDELHKIDKRGNHDVNWAFQHKEWIKIWKDRKNRVIEGEILRCEPHHSEAYMMWYWSNSKPFLSPEGLLFDPRTNIKYDIQYPSFFQGQPSNEAIYTPAPPSIFPEQASHHNMFTHSNPVFLQPQSSNEVMYTPGPTSGNAGQSSHHIYFTPGHLNEFSVFMGTPQSAQQYSHHLSSNRQVDDIQHQYSHHLSSDQRGNEIHDTTSTIVGNVSLENEPDNQQQLPTVRRRNPQRNPPPRCCGTGGKLGK